jgi:peptidoglycan hydrolase-like protein with peptidoglycan-binding domain
MENFKFVISSIIVIILLIGAGFWAFSSLESGPDHSNNQETKALEQKNKELEKELAEVKKNVALLESEKETEAKAEADVTEEQKDTAAETTKTEVTPTPPPAKTTVLKYQETITELEKMVSGNIYLKKGSQGAYVGTVQKFLNIYNKTSNKIDNDYGDGTVTLVKNYQKAVGLTSDGETGPNTYKKMITWLKAQ